MGSSLGVCSSSSSSSRFSLPPSQSLFCFSEGGKIGINYGRVANNLPSPASVVQLLQTNNLTHVKMYDADSTVLKSLSGSGITVTVMMPNNLLQATATSTSFAAWWVQRNVAAYYPLTKIRAVAVGNEVFADPTNLTSYLVPAMINVQAALVKLNLDKAIKVSSPVALTALQSSYPPSAGAFRSDLAELVMRPMLHFLRETGSYLMVNAYPFFAYEDNSNDISLDYALSRPNAGVLDPGSGLTYYSLLDAQIDAVSYAMSALKYDDVRIVISETGWPSAGDANEIGANVINAAAYNGNLIRRVLSGTCGTPKRPDCNMDVYLFALFNENEKPGPTSERNYGMFYPNEQKVYDVDFVLGNRNSSTTKNNDGNSNNSTGSSGSGDAASNGTGETWCVADPSAGKEKLQMALDFACGEGGADCTLIQPGAACYEPNTIEAHASYAFNSYYQKNSRESWTCNFGGTAYVVSQTPKIGKCTLPSSA
ncbi:glucan endo-1,3-beta-glucosidase 13 [Carex littledalei]|uniref:glucan endo-1,3-beta-D-glucosidase n=1 Tax=Carex littledalei TaxID=544730 RepID=A0A833R0P1_9POAL|nr:glucan endo-1,3-beta-glucosidase 13 [Carex littledalei]